MARILFARVGWMKEYLGPRDGDEKPIGGGSYNDKGIGHEAWSFVPRSDGYCYAYFQPFYKKGVKATINLERIDPGAGTDLLEDVLVIFFAKRPNVGGQYIVGWYKHATVRRQANILPAKLGKAGSDRHYFLKARIEDCTCVRPDDRSFVVVKKGRMDAANRPGTTNAFYTHDKDGIERTAINGFGWIEEAIKYVQSLDLASELPESEFVEEEAVRAAEKAAAAKGQGFGGTAEERKAIDERAMKVATTLLRDTKTFSRINDVSRTECYDLHCVDKKDKVTRVEVKGTRATICEKVFLTRGEVLSAGKYQTALVVVTGIVLERKVGQLKGKGGIASLTSPWKPKSADLQAITYEYRVGGW